MSSRRGCQGNPPASSRKARRRAAGSVPGAAGSARPASGNPVSCESPVFLEILSGRFSLLNPQIIKTNDLDPSELCGFIDECLRIDSSRTPARGLFSSGNSLGFLSWNYPVPPFPEFSPQSSCSCGMCCKCSEFRIALGLR